LPSRRMATCSLDGECEKLANVCGGITFDHL